MSNSQGHTTTYEYTPEYYCTRIVDPLGGVVQYEYNELGELLSETDEEGRVTRYAYDDEYGRIVEEVQPDGGVWKYTYREDGRLEQVTDPEGGIRAWQYDELGRVKGVVGSDQMVTRFAYDERHRISEVHDIGENVCRRRIRLERSKCWSTMRWAESCAPSCRMVM